MIEYDTFKFCSTLVSLLRFQKCKLNLYDIIWRAIQTSPTTGAIVAQTIIVVSNSSGGATRPVCGKTAMKQVHGNGNGRLFSF